MSSGSDGSGPTVSTNRLTREFGSQLALDGVTLDARAGEVLALLGPNGAGKTTTVRVLNGVLAPSEGSSRVLGLDPATDGDEVRRRTGVLTENAGLDDRLTARENLVSTAHLRGMRRGVDARVTELLEQFEMAERADRPVQGCSTGQRKRLALARALIHDPEVLFLDEPTSGLDPAATRDVVGLIASLAADRGRTVVLCTHFLGEAGRLADRMAVLDRGRLLAFGTPSELAAGYWRELEVGLDLGAAAGEGVLGLVRSVPGVTGAEVAPDGATVHVHGRDAVPALLGRLAAHEVAVYGAVPRPPTLEDVYFAVLLGPRGTDVSAPGRRTGSRLTAGAGRSACDRQGAADSEVPEGTEP